MPHSLDDKMYRIAEHLGQLNAKGKVKANTSNENGYATLAVVNAGCKVWIHHTLEGALIMDLMVTKASASKHPAAAKSAVTAFEAFAKAHGYSVSSKAWRHGIDSTSTRQQYYFDIGQETDAQIDSLISAVQSAFAAV